MKTRKGWSESRLTLDKYMPYPCEIDEEMYNYIGEVVAPNDTYHNDIVQCGEAYAQTKDYGAFTYATAIRIGDKYFYIGELPEFKNPSEVCKYCWR
jgi:hypothetical protein